MKKKHVIAVIIVVIIILGGVFGLQEYLSLREYKEQVRDMTISNVDLSRIPDGSYTGTSDVNYVSAEVKVTVKEHRITKIDLVKHNNGKGAKAESLPDKVIEKQSLDVDMVSGATASSKVILKAIENALESGVK